MMRKRRVLIIVENLPVPFDRRVWHEANCLRDAGYEVSVICPVGVNATERYQVIDDIHIYRHPLPLEARGALGYLLEYSSALFWEFILSVRIALTRGFDAIHACNPPDTIFIIGAFYKYLFGKGFLFDHHDINPELYETKFGRRDFFWRLLLRFERMTFSTADVSIATNHSYRQIAIERGGMDPERVFIVRSGPNLDRVRLMTPDDKIKKGRTFLVGYVGVIGSQEGLDLLIAAAKHLRVVRGIDDIHYGIIGDGPELATVKALAESEGVADVFTFFGRVDDETMFSVLSSSDVCVNPDRPNAMNDKSTMNKIMEYMALGKPIVQFDLTEGRFSAQDSSLYARNTDVADFGDKILDLLRDPARRENMGAFGRRRVIDELAWPYEAPKLLAAYDLLFAKRG